MQRFTTTKHLFYLIAAAALAIIFIAVGGNPPECLSPLRSASPEVSSLPRATNATMAVE
jgi:hypothetical protein